MLRGTRVANAYIGVTTDGRGINEGIVDAVDEAGPEVERAGDEQGDRYGRRFSDRFRERLSEISERASAALNDRLARGAERGGDQAGTRSGRSFTSRMRSVLDSNAEGIGESFADQIGDALTDRLESQIAGMLDDIEDRVGRVSGNGGRRGGGGLPPAPPGNGGGGVVGPGGQSGGPPPQWLRVLAAADRLNAAFDRDRRLDMDRAYRANEDFDRRRSVMLDRAFRMNESFDRARGIMVDRALRLNEAFDRRRTVMLDRAYRMNEDFIRRQGVMLERAYDMNRAFDRDREARERREGIELDRAYRMNDAYDRDRHRVLEAAHRMNEQFDRRRTVMLEQAYRMNADFDAGRRGGDGRPMSGGGTNESYGDRIGRLFGAGSRSNILNLLGRTIGNSINLVEKLRTGMGNLFDAIRSGDITLNSMVNGFKTFAVTLPTVGLALGTVVVVLGLMVSVMSALTALLTAMISTIASGLVGALAVAGGAMLAVVAAGGLLTAAFMSMTDAQKSLLKDAFIPLKEQMVGIGQVVLRDMIPAFGTWSSNLQRALDLLGPVAEVMGGAFAEAGNRLTASFSGPGFQRFATAMGTYLPSIVTRLSGALGGFLNGLTGMFAAIMPYVNQFAGYLEDVGNRFSDWANSTQGQNAIVDFVDRALDSLQDLWDFVTMFSGFISDVLFSPEGQAAGGTIFDGLTDAFEGFRQKIADGSLERWFSDAITFGRDLWGTMQALGRVIGQLNDAGILRAAGKGLEAIAHAFDAINHALEPVMPLISRALPAAIGLALAPLNLLATAVGAIGDAVGWVGDKISETMNKGARSMQMWANIRNAVGFGGTGGAGIMSGASNLISGVRNIASNIGSSASLLGSRSSYQSIGRSALQQTSTSSGGYRQPAEYQNPYVAFANSLIAQGPTTRQEIYKAMRSIADAARDGIRDAAKADSRSDVLKGMQSLASNILGQAQGAVDRVRSELSSNAQRLASASSAAEAAKALAQVRQSQADLAKAIQAQKVIQNIARTLDRQTIARAESVNKLLAGEMTRHATLADFAQARSILATRIEEANSKLTEAMALRDNFRKQVEDSIKAFGALTTAQAQVINGVTQNLTATDITNNLTDRLNQIRAFQNNLRILLAQGLSKAAYQQIVEQGVDGGAAYAEALVKGGNGAIQQVNGLVGAINGYANLLGKETSTRMYQAGVDAAQGLVDGLNSLSKQLENAATKLGNSIASAIRNALGIRSPSRVLIADMDHVGDGAVIGLDNQHAKVDAAATRFANRIAVSPEVAAYAASKGESPVSGNAPIIGGDVNIHTPTEDPKAVANEVINDITSRL